MTDHANSDSSGTTGRALHWTDVDPWAVMVFVISIVQLATKGFGWPWFCVSVWTFCFTGEKALRKAGDRQVELWKKATIAAHSTAVLLAYAANGGNLEASPPDRLKLDEAQRRVDRLLSEVKRSPNL